jgi:hypothetical protein
MKFVFFQFIIIFSIATYSEELYGELHILQKAQILSWPHGLYGHGKI